VVVHTPRKEKAARLDQIVELLQAEKIDPKLVVLDHLTPGLVPIADRLGTWAGITLQPGKVSPDELSVLLRARGPDRLLVDSDLSHAPSDPLTLPKAARHLWRDGHSAEAIERVTHRNAAKVFRLHSISEGS
jgi:predicted metal-dependent TIM-barrel fold hydrolase